jgi:hypothetical protein
MLHRSDIDAGRMVEPGEALIFFGFIGWINVFAV